MRWGPRKKSSVAPEGMTVRGLADFISDYFTKITRNNGEEIWALKDDAPGWITDRVIHPAHEDMMPDDWKYEFIYQALSHIHDIGNLDEPELEADVYNHDLLKWLASHLERAGIVDEAVKNFGHSESGIIGDISMGQWHEKELVYQSVLSSLRDIATEGDGEYS